MIAGACWASRVNNPAPGALPGKEPPCERDYIGGFSTSLMHKVCVCFSVDSLPSFNGVTQDMGLATAAASTLGCSTPLGAAAESVYKQMLESKTVGLAKKDFSSVYLYLKQMKQRNS